jgi:hypothetical protein
MDGALRCNGLVLQHCSSGKYLDGDTCAAACDANYGCVTCQPGTGTCTGNHSHACKVDGSGYTDTDCDPVQGSVCDPMHGSCTGPCAPQNLGVSYIGCEYYPTVTGNMVGGDFHFAVAIANTTTVVANITIENGALTMPDSFTVPPSSVVVHTLPWHPALKLCTGPSWSNCSGGIQADAALAPGGAYHLRSTAPVTVYEFNALEYQLTGSTDGFSYTNDASLLLPTNTWRSKYYATTWQQTGGTNPSELAVTAWHDNTNVTILAKAANNAAGGAPAFASGVAQMVTLNAGDVIELASKTGDYTGSIVTADQPVQVIAGHYCANIPDGVGYCDHLEQSMFGVETLSTHYIVNAPAVTTIPAGKQIVVRIVAAAGGVALTYDPPQPTAPTMIANPGDFVEIDNTTASFQITGSGKILVAQYMEGQAAGGNTGDPSMFLAVPIEQFRTTYMFHAPTNYDANFVDITAPMGALVTLDGAPIPPLTPIGGTGYGLARIFPLTNGPGGDGNHSMQGSQAFGITVYGYGQYTSYAYPGGLDLNTIID